MCGRGSCALVLLVCDRPAVADHGAFSSRGPAPVSECTGCAAKPHVPKFVRGLPHHSTEPCAEFPLTHPVDPWSLGHEPIRGRPEPLRFKLWHGQAMRLERCRSLANVIGTVRMLNRQQPDTLGTPRSSLHRCRGRVEVIWVTWGNGRATGHPRPTGAAEKGRR